jgi:hypothetical protein
MTAHRSTGAVAALIATLTMASPAFAITCESGYQRVQGNLIATPYCQDELLAQVARQFGVKASGDRIRGNPNFKREVCAIAGRDIRVESVCVDSNPTGRTGRF